MPNLPQDPAIEGTQLVAEYARHQAAAQPHLEAMDRIKERLRELYDYGSHQAGNLTVQIARGASFDASAFTRQYPPELNPTFYKAVPDSKAIPENLREHFMKQGTARVTIK
jgi:hypothetical protein